MTRSSPSPSSLDMPRVEPAYRDGGERFVEEVDRLIAEGCQRTAIGAVDLGGIVSLAVRPVWGGTPDALRRDTTIQPCCVSVTGWTGRRQPLSVLDPRLFDLDAVELTRSRWLEAPAEPAVHIIPPRHELGVRMDDPDDPRRPVGFDGPIQTDSHVAGAVGEQQTESSAWGCW